MPVSVEVDEGCISGGANAPPDAASTSMERYAAGDEGAFSDLYDLVAPRLYRYLLRRTRDAVCAEDLLQQTLLHIHRARGSFIPGADVMPWVLAIARRIVIDSARSAHREIELTNETEALNVAATTDCADDIVEAKELALQLERELARLPQPQQLAFELLRRRGFSPAEAAEILETTVGAVKLRAHRAHQSLRAALGRKEGLPWYRPRN